MMSSHINDCYSELMAYTALSYSYWASFHDVYGWLHHATKDTDYSCLIEAIELILPII